MKKYLVSLLILLGLLGSSAYAALDFTADETLKILETANSVGPGVDARAWNDVKALFTTLFAYDFRNLPTGELSADNADAGTFIDTILVPIMAKYDVTHHRLTNPRVYRINALTAIVKAQASSYHRCAAEVTHREWTDLGQYEFQLRRYGRNWKISKYVYIHTQTQGERNAHCLP